MCDASILRCRSSAIVYFHRATMLSILFLLLCLTEHGFAKEPPDVECIVVHVTSVHCFWNKQGTPEVNYTISSWFINETPSECVTYLSQNSTNTGCIRPYKNSQRFGSFYTKLTYGNSTFQTTHDLKARVKLNPPTNLTVQNGSDSNLWFYWNQTSKNCVESEVRYRINNKKWQTSEVSVGRQKYCINLISSSSQYELQVRSRIGNDCGKSLFWSDWSQPVVWGSNNGTEPNQPNSSMTVWTTVLSVMGPFTLILLVIMLLHHERLRIIFIPVVPKPSLIHHDIENWLQMSKGLKEGFKASYNERACPVREYCHVSQSDSESSDSSTFSVTTDQTDCSISIPSNESEESTACSSSSEDEQVSV
ncbi:cytokine receptor common subunit gamma-like [Scomber japonicus]|uniref:cytokine receptor common subunit gamma-like n=1 Tax=Scomber japonicus TaxID=13676 RepID=UPI002306859A|nr:cytokine receptor common subunit gamma-like [Scomber japonicus]